MQFRIRLALVAGCLAVAPLEVSAQGTTCTGEQLRKAVDDAGGGLRKLNMESQPRIEAGLKRLRDKFGWSEDTYVEKATILLSDAKSEAYDGAASALLIKLDRLSEMSGETTDCAKLGDLETTALELQATVRVKTQYMLSRIDALLGESPKAPASEAPVAPTQPPGAPVPAGQPSAPQIAAPRPQSPAVQPASPAPQAKTPPAAKQTGSSWNTSTVEDTVKLKPPVASQAPLAAPPRAASPPMPPITTGDESFSVEEIRDASRGFFGTISSGFANVIEHAFAKLGRPNAYVLGNEGGGAFLAGVRYGRGTLFTRGSRTREVYWHGPSIGYDFGASGSKTMFLVYNLNQDLDIFAGFSGVDGSAFLVGGVGMTVLTDGKVVMAPIRSGVGLRFGASIGYVRFTPQPTWNPF